MNVLPSRPAAIASLAYRRTGSWHLGMRRSTANAQPPVVPGAEAARCPAPQPPQQPPESPGAVGPAGRTRLPPSAAARHTDSPPRYPSRSCPCATAPLAAGRVPQGPV